MRTRRDPPDRIFEDTEHCVVCALSQVRELVYRCAACDRGVCAICVVLVWPTGEAFCVGCHEISAGDG